MGKGQERLRSTADNELSNIKLRKRIYKRQEYEKSIDSGVTISNVVIVIFRREGGSFFYPDGPF